MLKKKIAVFRLFCEMPEYGNSELKKSRGRSMQVQARAITKWRPLGLKKPHLAGSLYMSNTIGARLAQATLLDRFAKLSSRRSSIRVPRLVFGQQVSLCKDGAHCFMRYVRQRHEGVAWFAAVVAAEGHRRF